MRGADAKNSRSNEMKKQITKKQIRVRVQVRAGAWQFCKALKCDTIDKGGAPNTCKAVECVK